MSKIFFIPNKREKNDKITQKEIETGSLKIPEDNKRHFPEESCDVTIIVDDVEYTCPFVIKDTGARVRSYTIELGTELFEKIGIKATDILEFERIDDTVYKLCK